MGQRRRQGPGISSWQQRGDDGVQVLLELVTVVSMAHSAMLLQSIVGGTARGALQTRVVRVRGCQ